MAVEGYIETTLTKVEELTTGFVTEAYIGMGDSIADPVKWLVALLFILFTGRAWLGRMAANDFVLNFIRIVFIYYFIIHTGEALEVLNLVFIDFPYSVAIHFVGIATGSADISPTNAIGILMDSGFLLASNLYEESNFISLGSIYAFMIIILTLFVAVAAFGYLMVAYIIAAILFAVFPLFLVLFLFVPTKGLYEGWLRAATVVALVPIFTFALIAFGHAVTEDSVSEALLALEEEITVDSTCGSGNTTRPCTKTISGFELSDLNPFLLIYGGILVVFWQMLPFVRQIAGGAGITSLGALRDVGRTAATHARSGIQRGVGVFIPKK